ncbi:MAG TPA: hypothetical protein VH280_16975 [Verrucomicrobiae bacterium]|jgi:hypothetical protein|nr:hypothetical protein [Verrucomicrobiae bacterium]
METINPAETPLIVEAVLLWTGKGKSPCPRRDEQALRTRFGSEIATKLLSVIKSLEKEYYMSEAWKVASNLQDMGRMATEEFKKNHPDIPDRILEAFAWCYTFDYK